MSKVITELKPQSLWHNFMNICQVPHASKNEQQLGIYLADFGKNLGLETALDEGGNVLIRKPATPGLEHYPTIVLQAHYDMVPQQDANIKFDFDKDAIIPFIEGDWVRAKGTTLGADNGIGAAAIMAVLEDENLKHGPIEALFTANEELGMTGAQAFKPGLLRGKFFLCLDGEDADAFEIGSAACVYTEAKVKYIKTAIANNVKSYKLKVSGLPGGHSAEAIEVGGANNAIKVLVNLLLPAAKKCGLRLGKLTGGEFPSSVPKEASAEVVIPLDNEAAFAALIEEIQKQIKQELVNTSPNLKIEILDLASNEIKYLLDEKSQNSLLNLIYACPNGIFKMSEVISGLIETSTCLSQITFTDDAAIVLTRQRSSSYFQLEKLTNMVSIVFELAGAEVRNFDFFPAWPPNPNSPLLQLAKKIFLQVNQREPKIIATHGGLECGFFQQKYPDLDIIAIGPNIVKPHSTDEKVNIKSVEAFWKVLGAILENIFKI
jgi:dipeptidase D